MKPPSSSTKAAPSQGRRGTAKPKGAAASKAGGTEQAADADSSDSSADVVVEAEAELIDGDLDGDFAEPRAIASVALPVRSGTSLSRLDPLEAYMRQVQAHKLLTPEEEHALAVRYTETADVDAAARLVTAHLRLVVKIAFEYRRAYRNMMDLIQEGNMGLMQAVRKYDPYRGVKLSSYAAYWIRAYMLRYILANFRMVKLGTTQAQRKLFFNLNKEKAKLTAMGIEPTAAEVARRLDVQESEVEEMEKRLARGDASLDAPMNESDGRSTTRVELLPAPGTSPEQVNEGAELNHLLRVHLDEFRKNLVGKDLIIFDERLIADEPKTLAELGEHFGVSRERIRQLEARLTGRLREYLADRLGDAVQMD
jgi:RNA polymerase sigma-32 factor